MTKKELAEKILDKGSGVIDKTKFYQGVNNFTKVQLETMLKYINWSPNSIEDANCYINRLIEG